MKVQILTSGVWAELFTNLGKGDGGDFCHASADTPRLGVGRWRKSAHNVDASMGGMASLLLSTGESPDRVVLRPLL